MSLYTLNDFKRFFSNIPQLQVEGGNAVNIAEYWFNHNDANDAYNGMDLQPDLEPCSLDDGYLNIWQGFGVNDLAVSETDVQLVNYLNHARYIICNDNVEHYDELLRFLAHLRQRPEEKPLYAIVLESEEHGTGKSTFLQPLVTMCGTHGTEVQKGERVFGKFNSRIANLILVVLEEAFAGSNDATNSLKNLITSYIMELEKKGIDAIEVENYLRLILTTNQVNIIKIDSTERRYFYLKVSASKLNNTEYFETLNFTIPKRKSHIKFVSKLSYFLKNYPLPPKYIPKNPPNTKTLGMKKLDNLSPEHKFIYRMLYSGSNTSAFGSFDWQERVSNKELEVLYEEFKKGLRKHTLDKESQLPLRSIGIMLTRLGMANNVSKSGRSREMLEYKIPEYKNKFCDILGLPSDIFECNSND
ncbi:Hypothetical predicted protein [Paramuricea clavata]|uniref:NrS-1 polymerase-like helicase domain-containing protein n=1 Tax=Paramuricea clavata TaxID=317549 RepID=A0A6S7LCE0_PARCT|nr:Hypothetical predicted protein [Paramuricea clavata]